MGMTMQRSQSNRRLAAGLLLAAAVAGCGTTVPLNQTTAGGNGGVTGQGPVLGDGLSADSGSGTVPGGAAGATAPGSISSGEGAAGAPGSGTVDQAPGGTGSTAPESPALPVASGAVPTTGPGWDAKRVYIGFPTQNDATRSATALGLENLDFGDIEGDINAVVADLNSRGGLFGRQVVPVFRDNATADLLSDPARVGQANCTYFSQDRRVVAVVNVLVLLDVDSFRSCLAKEKIPFFVASGLIDDKVLESLRGYIYNASPTWNTYAPLLAQRLEAQGFFEKWNSRSGGPGAEPVKVGLLIYAGTPTSQRIGQLISAALKRQGYAPATTFTYTDVTGSQMPNAVLRFRSEGVTHVFDYTAALRQFMVTAEQQGYRPRYAVVSSIGPRDQIAAQVPAEQLRGALGLGFCPTCDVATPQDPGSTPGGPSCRQILSKRGIKYEGEPKRTALGVAYFFCDGIRLFADAFRAGEGLLPGNLEAGAAKVGSAFAPAITFRSGLRAGRPIVAGAARDFGWGAACSCFTYGPTVTSTS